jgi:hypothetical protein
MVFTVHHGDMGRISIFNKNYTEARTWASFQRQRKKELLAPFTELTLYGVGIYCAVVEWFKVHMLQLLVVFPSDHGYTACPPCFLVL